MKPPTAFKPPTMPAAPTSVGRPGEMPRPATVPVQSPEETQRRLMMQQNPELTAPATPVAKPPSAFKPPTTSMATAAGVTNPNLDAAKGWGPDATVPVTPPVTPPANNPPSDTPSGPQPFRRTIGGPAPNPDGSREMATRPEGGTSSYDAEGNVVWTYDNGWWKDGRWIDKAPGGDTGSVIDTLNDYAPSPYEDAYRRAFDRLEQEFQSPEAMARARNTAESQARMNISSALQRNPNMSGTQRENLGVMYQGNAIASGEMARNDAFLQGNNEIRDAAARGDDIFLSEWERRMTEAMMRETAAETDEVTTPDPVTPPTTPPVTPPVVPPVTPPTTPATSTPPSNPPASSPTNPPAYTPPAARTPAPSRTVSGPMPQRPSGGGVASQDAQGNWVWTYPDGWWSNGQWIAKPPGQSQTTAPPANPPVTPPATTAPPARPDNPDYSPPYRNPTAPPRYTPPVIQPAPATPPGSRPPPMATTNDPYRLLGGR